MEHHTLMVTKPFTVRIEGGVGYIHLTSGRAHYEAAMPVHDLLVSHTNVDAALKDWLARQAAPLPLRPGPDKPRRHAARPKDTPSG